MERLEGTLAKFFKNCPVQTKVPFFLTTLSGESLRLHRGYFFWVSLNVVFFEFFLCLKPLIALAAFVVGMALVASTHNPSFRHEFA